MKNLRNILLILLSAFLGYWIGFSEQQDYCLDQGGSWFEEQNMCLGLEPRALMGTIVYEN